MYLNHIPHHPLLFFPSPLVPSPKYGPSVFMSLNLYSTYERKHGNMKDKCLSKLGLFMLFPTNSVISFFYPFIFIQCWATRLIPSLAIVSSTAIKMGLAGIYHADFDFFGNLPRSSAAGSHGSFIF
jgi:hypothetical protein